MAVANKYERELSNIIQEYRSSIVVEMLTASGKTPNKLKADNVPILAALFASPAHHKKVAQSFNEYEKMVLWCMQQFGGRASLNRLHRRLKAALPDKFNWLDPETAHPNGTVTPNYEKKTKPSLHDVLAGLARKGVLFSNGHFSGDSKTVLDWPPGRNLFVSPAFHVYFNSLRFPALPARTNIEPPYVRQSSPSFFLRNLIRLARYVERKNPLTFTVQGYLYKNDLREVADELSFAVQHKTGKKETDTALLYFMRRMLRGVGLVNQKHGWNMDMLPNADSRFRQASLAGQVEQCYRAWLMGEVWHELAQVPAYQSGVNVTVAAPKELAGVRTAVLEHLHQLGTGWQILEDVVEDLRSEGYGFLFPERSITGYRTYNWRTGQYEVETPYIARNNRYGVSFKEIKTEKEGWNKVEAELINHIIAGPLYWLGLVDLGYDSEPAVDYQGNQKISYYRLTEYGQWLINKQAKPQSSASGTANVLVQPNFEIMVMGQAGDDLLMTLDLFCQVVNEQEYTTTFKVTRQSVYAAQKLGWPVSRILAYLEEVTHKPVPQNVRRSLEEWGALQERITIRQKVLLVHTADTAVADEIAANPAFAAWRRIAPTAFLTNDDPAKASQALDQAHWIPLRTPAKETSAPNSIVITDDGAVTFIQPTPSIYAHGLLQNLTAETDHGRVLTPALVKAATQESSLQEVVNQLQKLHRGNLSHKLIIRLKSWVNYYGPAQLDTLTLIEFSSLRIRDELLADPELAPFLTKFEAANRALAIVVTEQITAVETILRDRNITITHQLSK